MSNRNRRRPQQTEISRARLRAITQELKDADPRERELRARGGSGSAGTDGLRPGSRVIPSAPRDQPPRWFRWPLYVIGFVLFFAAVLLIAAGAMWLLLVAWRLFIGVLG